jgi:hypothetical protein
VFQVTIFKKVWIVFEPMQQVDIKVEPMFKVDRSCQAYVRRTHILSLSQAEVYKDQKSVVVDAEENQKWKGIYGCS